MRTSVRRWMGLASALVVLSWLPARAGRASPKALPLEPTVMPIVR